MRSSAPYIVCFIAFAAVLSSYEPLQAAVVFDDLDRGPITTNSIDPHRMRAEPFRTMEKADKVYAPMPGFQQNQILPDRIRMSPINCDDMMPSHIRPDQLHFTAITKADILPQKLDAKPLVQPISPGEKMAMPVRPAAPQFGLTPEMEAASKPSEYFDSYIRLDMNRQSMPAPPSPMGW